MEDFTKYSDSVILYSKTFNFDLETMTSYFENPNNVGNTPITDQFFYFYKENNELFLKTGGYVVGTTKITYSAIYKLGDLIKTPFKHYRQYKLINWNGEEINFDIFFLNYFYLNTCENKTCVFRMLSSNYNNNEEKEIYMKFLSSLKKADFHESYLKGIEYMIQDKSIKNEMFYSTLLRNCKAENVFSYIKSNELYSELLDSENLNMNINGIIGDKDVTINLFDNEGQSVINYSFNKAVVQNDQFILEFKKNYSKKVKILQKFHVCLIKISDNDSFLYIKKEILNLVTFDKLNLLKYILLAYFMKIKDKFNKNN